MFCPTCRSDFHEHSLIDPYLRGYACTHRHVFYETVIQHLGGIPTADTVQPPPMSDDVQILKFWLTDAHARERVPNQLALVCRRMVDIIERDHHVPYVENLFAFCPTCGEPLSRFDSDDVYMQGSRCRNDHEFWERGGTAYYQTHGGKANLSAELVDRHLPQLIDYYAGDDAIIQPYVHPQLRAVLKRFIARFLHDA
jgi:hypothetical protein